MKNSYSHTPPTRSDQRVEWSQLKLRLEEWVTRSQGTDYSAFLREVDLLLEQVPSADRKQAREYIEELRAKFQPAPIIPDS